MPPFVEFLLIACVLFLWESTLWLPLRSITLRRRLFSHRWRWLRGDNLLVVRDLGLVPMLPVPPDTRLAPCQAPPLGVDDHGSYVLESTSGRLECLPSLTWDDLHEEDAYLSIRGRRTRLQSPRTLETLRHAKRRGVTLEAAVRNAWRMALSPSRAKREWRRWRIAAAPLELLGPVLAAGFFIGLPCAYIYVGVHATLLLGLWLWCLMACVAIRLWWLGSRVYPGARASLRMDAVLTLLVPFHAMRGMEIASVHAMATTHPAALLLTTGDRDNPWLGTLARRILHPLPGDPADQIHAACIRPALTAALASAGISLLEFDHAPDATADAQAVAYCPRCHGRYVAGVTQCPDCKGVMLQMLDSSRLNITPKA